MRFITHLDFAKACLICANDEMKIDRIGNRSLYASDNSSPLDSVVSFSDVISLRLGLIPISEKSDVIVVACSSRLSLRKMFDEVKTKKNKTFVNLYLLKESGVEQHNRH